MTDRAPIADEQLVAYVDGELDADAAEKLASRERADPEFAERVASYRRIRKTLYAAYAGVLREPIPARLNEAALGESRNVVVFGRPRQRIAPVFGTLAAMAASLFLGILAGLLAGNGGGPVSQLTAVEEGIVAAGALAHTLETRPSGRGAHAGINPRFTFARKGGGYCRVFETQTATGLACRSGNRWIVRALAPAPPSQMMRKPEGVRPAGATDMPKAVRDALERLMAGDPLGGPEEQRVLRSAWQAPKRGVESGND